jgi:hypothetical protein
MECNIYIWWQRPGEPLGGAACIFQYVYISKKPEITFASNWFGTDVPHALGNSMEYCWANLPRHGPGTQLTIAIKGLPGRPSWIKHHSVAMTILGVQGHVLHTLSRCQLRFEYKQPKIKDLEPNNQPAGTQNEEEIEG